MLDQRNPKLDLAALALLALTIFLSIALVTYNPADPPSDLVYPPQAEIENACGWVGAIVATALFQTLGLGAYYLVISLAVLDAALLSHRPLGDPWLRSIGWLLSLAGLTTLATMAVPQLSPGPVIGAGGYLGATFYGLLSAHVATAGSYVLAISVMAAGWLLATDYLLVRISACLLAIPARGVGRAIGRADTTAQRRGKVRTDLSPAAIEDDDDAGPQVRIARKPGPDDRNEPSDEAEDAVNTEETLPGAKSSGGVQVAERKSGTVRVR